MINQTIPLSIPIGVNQGMELHHRTNMQNVVVVGLGPHSKRIYLRHFAGGYFALKLVVDLDVCKDEIESYLAVNNYQISTLFIPTEFRDHEALPQECQTKLLSEIRRLHITHAIISTEPKAHFAYLRFFLAHGIHTLCDKPITAPSFVSTNQVMAQKIKDDYDELKKIYLSANEEKNVKCQIQCQRRWHEGYVFIRALLKECISNYEVPITNLDVYHCDGMWNMPNEYLSRDNHPYKYGYGKLFHSGYHFVDLMCWLERLNHEIVGKSPNEVEIYTTVTRPSDHMKVMDEKFYRNFLGTEKFHELFNSINQYGFDQFGELDFFGLLQFKRDNHVISTCNLNLLQTGFSRRSWVELPLDTYKSNGRVRHERINIQVGPLLNIQVHSYQSTEIKDRHESNQYDVGGLEHFDIYVFRNVDLIGGSPFEKYSMTNLSQKPFKTKFIGFNERAREQCVIDFLSPDGKSQSDLMDHEFTVSILSALYKSICNRNDGCSPVLTVPL